jgi:hypothetical protein
MNAISPHPHRLAVQIAADRHGTRAGLNPASISALKSLSSESVMPTTAAVPAAPNRRVRHKRRTGSEMRGINGKPRRLGRLCGRLDSHPLRKLPQTWRRWRLVLRVKGEKARRHLSHAVVPLRARWATAKCAHEILVVVRRDTRLVRHDARVLRSPWNARARQERVAIGDHVVVSESFGDDEGALRDTVGLRFMQHIRPGASERQQHPHGLF